MARNITLLPERLLPTPFGKVKLPTWEFPPRFGLPQVDSRQRGAVKHAMACDLARFISGAIPYIGGFVAEQVTDLHFAEIRKILTPEEMTKYMEETKRLPTTSGAMLYSFVGG